MGNCCQTDEEDGGENMQSKRIQVNEINLGAAGRVDVVLNVPSSPRESVNFHNIWIGATCEPQNAGANCQGSWILFFMRDPAAGIPAFTDVFMNLETLNATIVACGVFSASNESVWTLPPTQIKTSRTLEAGGRLILQCIVTGITAGLASTRVSLCAHTVRA